MNLEVFSISNWWSCATRRVRMSDRSLKVERVSMFFKYKKGVNKKPKSLWNSSIFLYRHFCKRSVRTFRHFSAFHIWQDPPLSISCESGQRGHCQGSSGGMRQILLGPRWLRCHLSWWKQVVFFFFRNAKVVWLLCMIYIHIILHRICKTLQYIYISTYIMHTWYIHNTHTHTYT